MCLLVGAVVVVTVVVMVVVGRVVVVVGVMVVVVVVVMVVGVVVMVVVLLLLSMMVVVVVVILVGMNVSMAYLWDSCWRCYAFPISQRGGLGPFGPEMHLCCYTNTCTKYPSTLMIEMQTIFKQVGLFIKCPVNIKEMKSFVMGHGLQPPVDVQDLVVM